MDTAPDFQRFHHHPIQQRQYFLETGELSDCNFIVGQEPHQQVLKGHKLLLAMASPVFRAMFYENMVDNIDPIPITDIQPETFKTLLKYIYTDGIDLVLVAFQSTRELCYCAKKYMLPHLVKDCMKYLIASVSPNTACETYEFAKLLELTPLKEKCMYLFLTKTTEILNEPSWENVKLDTLLIIFDKDKLQISSEIELFAALERWAKAECTRKSLNPSDNKCLRSVIGNALSKIRFLSLTPQQFADGTHRSLLLTINEAYSIIMNICGSQCTILMPDEFSGCIVTRVKPEKSLQYCS